LNVAILKSLYFNTYCAPQSSKYGDKINKCVCILYMYVTSTHDRPTVRCRYKADR